MYYIGIDLGTSSVKLLLMAADGEIVKTVTREYPLYFPHEGRAEQNPEDWWLQSAEGIKELMKSFPGDKTEVKIGGISFGGQMHGLVILDGNDNVIRPAILWNDGRSGEETEYLNSIIGKEKLLEYTANIAYAGFTAPKILWLKKHEPENFAKIAKIMLPKDYIAYRLTGIFSTDYSDASGTLLLDVKNKKWSPEMLEICGISEKMLPKLYESFEKTGCLKPDIARELGINPDCIVAAGAGDNAAASIGTGTAGKKHVRCNISVGTSGTIFVSGVDFADIDFAHDMDGVIHSFAHGDGGFHFMGCMLSAASCNKWWVCDIAKTGDYRGEDMAITDDMQGRSSVYFLPYLMGERSPHNDPDARGCFIGMTLNTSHEEMRLAVLEGVAYGIRDSLEKIKEFGINIEEATMCGGGAKGELWVKIFANVLGIKISIPESEEGPAFGAAILAAVAAGEYGDISETAGFSRIKKTEFPDAEIKERYEKKYGIYRQLYDELKGAYRLIKQA